jgi:predicted nucleotidyltransferase
MEGGREARRLTLEAMADVDMGRVDDHQAVRTWVANLEADAAGRSGFPIRGRSLEPHVRSGDVHQHDMQGEADSGGDSSRGTPPTGLSTRRVRSIFCHMDKEQIIATLRAHEPELHRRGIRHAALFGSVARGAATATSDIDILIELEPEAPIGVFEYVALTDYIGTLFPMRTDIANRAMLKPLVRPAAERDAIYAF